MGISMTFFMNFLIALVLLFSAIVDGKITLGEPIQYPTNFYELYEFVETEEPGWVFGQCEVSGSRLHWKSAVNLFENTGKEFEERAFGMLMLLFLAPKEYSYDICGDVDGKPILFGQGVAEFFTWYSNPEKYEQERFPIIAEGIAENFAKLIYIFGITR